MPQYLYLVALNAVTMFVIDTVCKELNANVKSTATAYHV